MAVYGQGFSARLLHINAAFRLFLPCSGCPANISQSFFREVEFIAQCLSVVIGFERKLNGWSFRDVVNRPVFDSPVQQVVNACLQ